MLWSTSQGSRPVVVAPSPYRLLRATSSCRLGALTSSACQKQPALLAACTAVLKDCFAAAGSVTILQSQADFCEGRALLPHTQHGFLTIRHKSSKREVRPGAAPFHSATASSGGVAVRFLVPHLELQFGEQLKCVGEHAALGNWYDNAAPFLSWTDGHNWIHHSQLPPGIQKFKLMIVRDGGSKTWEEGNDRQFEVPESVEGVLEVSCKFGDTAVTHVQAVDASIVDERIEGLEAEDAEIADPEPAADPVHTEQEIDSLEGTGTETKPESLADAQSVLAPDGENHGSNQENPEEEEALEGVSAPASDAGQEEDPAPAENASVAEAVHHEEDPAAANLPEPVPVHTDHESSQTNGSSTIRMFGGAMVEQLSDDSLFVTFADDEDGEDTLSIAERLLASDLPV